MNIKEFTLRVWWWVVGFSLGFALGFMAMLNIAANLKQ
jgi:hypothetical protein